MKKTLLLVLPMLLLAVAGFSQKKSSKTASLSDDVLAIADQLKIDYKGLVKKASAKDTLAIHELLEFSRMLDNQTAINHAVTCLEIIPLAGDAAFAQEVSKRLVKLKALLLNQITQAQSLTQKEALKKPMSEWAPYTWEALNNRQYYIPSKDAPKAGTDGSIQTAVLDTESGVPAPKTDAATPSDATTPTPTSIEAPKTRTTPGRGN